MRIAAFAFDQISRFNRPWLHLLAMGDRIKGTSNALFSFLPVYFRRDCHCGSTLFITKKKKKWKKIETSLKGRLIFFFFSVRALLYPLYPKIPCVFE